jgi:hypothetical protein
MPRSEADEPSTSLVWDYHYLEDQTNPSFTEDQPVPGLVIITIAYKFQNLQNVLGFMNISLDYTSL